MLIIKSDTLNVYMFKDIDYKGAVTFTVKYGFEVKTFERFKAAIIFYSNCCEHSAQCEGLNHA